MGDPSPQAKEANKNKQLNANKGTKKPLKKTANKSKFEDLAIQGTNNSSIASKLSVERIYFQKLKTNISVDNENEVIPYFQWFVGKAIRRSPCINRGYWLRLEAVRSRLWDIIKNSDKKKICIVNLGCGFDPLPFEVLDSKNSSELTQYNLKNNKPISFVDIDYPDLLEVKKKLIANNPHLETIVKESGDNYKMITCDLNNGADYARLLENEIAADTIKVFIAEVSLAYMKPQYADRVILESGKLPNSHFILMEQLMPQGPSEPFARQMLKHFKKNESPLQSVGTYQTIKQQISRFEKHGWSKINCSDMYELWENLSPELKQSVERVEPFDELEEFSLFAHSYIVLHATNNENYQFCFKFQEPMAASIDDYGIASSSTQASFLWEDGDYERKFGASSADGLYCGGYSNARLNNIIDTKTGELLECKSVFQPEGRVYHTFTKLSATKYMLLGGRTAPNKILRDCWFWENNEWTRSEFEAPEPLYRHSVMTLSNGGVLIISGHEASHHYLFNEHTGFTVAKCDLPHVNSGALCHQNDRGYLIGGEFESGLISSAMYTFDVDDQSSEIRIVTVTHSPLFRRYAAKSAIFQNEGVFLVGGISDKYVFGQKSTMVLVENGNAAVEVELPEDIWKDSMVLCGFEMQAVGESEYVVFGGGAVCYGFGSIWNNRKLRIKIGA
ncbi:hypothetical protein ACO0QE_002985 [Hanseniaspora vineae]